MEIKISRSAHGCAACERPFEHDQVVHSLVNKTEGALERQDFCSQCWRAELGVSAFSVWNTRFYDPKVAEQGPPEAFSPLRQVFYSALDTEERTELATAFLAAQLLRRQKVFRLLRESEEAEREERLLLFVDRIGNRLIEVRDPRFSYAELEKARTLLMQRLQELESGVTMDTSDVDSAREVCDADAS